VEPQDGLATFEEREEMRRQPTQIRGLDNDRHHSASNNYRIGRSKRELWSEFVSGQKALCRGDTISGQDLSEVARQRKQE